MKGSTPDNRIFLLTRCVLAVVIVALVIAFLILYLNPHTTKERFAWEIMPPLTALFMGAGYLSGAYLFIFAVFGKQWHRVTHGFLPVATLPGRCFLLHSYITTVLFMKI